MTPKEQLQQHLANLEGYVGVLQKKIDLAAVALQAAEVSFGLDAANAKLVQGRALTVDELKALQDARNNSYDSLTQALEGMGALRAEITEAQNILARLRD